MKETYLSNRAKARQSARVKEIKHDKISSDLDEYLSRLVVVEEESDDNVTFSQGKQEPSDPTYAFFTPLSSRILLCYVETTVDPILPLRLHQRRMKRGVKSKYCSRHYSRVRLHYEELWIGSSPF